MEDMEDLLSRRIVPDLEDNAGMLARILGNSVDQIRRDFVYQAHGDIRGALFYTDGLVNAQLIEKSILQPLMLQASSQAAPAHIRAAPGDLLEHVAAHVLTNTSVRFVETYDQALLGLLSGDTLLFLDQCLGALQIATRGWESRSVDEPQTETVVRGPRDGFTENIRTNTALVRRRIRDPRLKIDPLNIGTRSRTDVNILYIEGLVKDGLVEEVRKRLERIDMDGIIESGYIEELIDDAPLSPFTTIQSTERPDKVASQLLEGRVAILVDNTPFALTMPIYFWQFFQASDDYYSRYWVGSFFRFVRYIAFVISLTLPSLYVMLVSFHHEMIPTPLALSIAAGRESVPFPALMEALIMELAFELMREAGLRLPKPVGQAVSIVGSLVIGQAAVQAGLVSPAMVIIVALTGISSFAIPNYAAAFSIRLLRFPLLFASGILGLLGFAAVFSLLTIHALSLRSFGESYLAPATPFIPSDQKDILIRYPWWKMDVRPQLAKDDQRQKDDSIPKPPETVIHQKQQPDPPAPSEEDPPQDPQPDDDKKKRDRPWRRRGRDS